MTAAPVLVANQITKAYGATRALRGASLALHPGEIVGLAGPNGSGKSTLGRIVAGFTLPDSGTACIGGTPSAEFREAHGVGFQPEETGRDWSSASVRDVLVLSAHPGTDMAAHETVAQLRLTSLLATRIRDLSKGQWRLTLAACALIRRPRLIVLDEPDAGLDALALDRLSIALKSAAQNGSGILMLSHHLDEMSRTADRVLFVRRGLIVDELRRDHPAFVRLRERFAALMAEGM